MKIVTVNEGRNIGTAGYLADLHKIKSAFPKAVIGWQEIDEADPANEHGGLADVFNGYHFVNFKSKEPILVPPGVHILRDHVERISDGVPHVSPPRTLSEVWIRVKGSDSPVVILNTHLIAGAWNKKIEPTQEIRRKYWWESVDKMKERIKFHHDAGRTVFWMGDVNRMDMPKLHKDERRLVSTGIDSISVIVGETKVKKVDEGALPLNSDHDARWVQVEFN